MSFRSLIDISGHFKKSLEKSGLKTTGPLQGASCSVQSDPVSWLPLGAGSVFVDKQAATGWLGALGEHSLSSGSSITVLLF